jgi:hypothetical protein
MRLKPEKIERLAQAIAEALARNPEVTMPEARDKTVALIQRVITEDFKEEDEIEALARKMVEAHATQIMMRDVSMDKLVLKGKQKIARERKFVL